MPMRFRVAVSWFERFVIGAFKLHQHRRSTNERSTRPRFAGRGLTISRFIPLHTMSQPGKKAIPEYRTWRCPDGSGGAKTARVMQDVDREQLCLALVDEFACSLNVLDGARGWILWGVPLPAGLDY
jgi:hypothetical protein